MDRLPPKPAGAVFGLEVDGERRQIGFQRITEAEQGAAGHVVQGRKVTIFDMMTGKIVKRLS